MVTRKSHPKKFFTEGQKNRIIGAIREAERKTSGEIRVYLERKGEGEIMSRAGKIFEKLGMSRTKHQNGILIYLSLANRSFAVLGDQGIHNKVGDEFWREIVESMKEFFARKK